MKYPYSAIPSRGKLKFPNGAKVALIVTANLEYWDMIKDTDKPYYAGGPAILPDSLPGNVPDFPNFMWRSMGNVLAYGELSAVLTNWVFLWVAP